MSALAHNRGENSEVVPLWGQEPATRCGAAIVGGEGLVVVMALAGPVYVGFGVVFGFCP